MTWQIGIASGACTDCSILDVIPALKAAGARGIEVGTPPRHFDAWRDDQVAALGESLRHAAMHAVSIHAPFGEALDLADPNPQHRHAAIGAILTAAGALKRLGGRLVVAHPSDLERTRHDVRERLADSARSLAVVCEHCHDLGLTLAIESPLPHLVGGHPDEFAWLLDHVNPAVRVCLDTGHTSLGGHWPQFMRVAGTRLVHVHASDNHGRYDDHLPPGDGAIDWTAIARSLREAAFDGWIMLELRCPQGDLATSFRRAFTQAHAIFDGRLQG
jgi:sugar phosphate isomerase/epimerase